MNHERRRTIHAHPGMTYESLRERFSWRIPEKLNLGVACSDSHVPGDPALIVEDMTGTVTTFTFGDLARQSNRLANGFKGLGIQAGDRVGLVLPQSVTVGLCHLALWKIGAVSLPLAGLFGPDAIRYRLEDSGAKAVITDARNEEKVRDAVPDGCAVLVEGEGGDLDGLLTGSAQLVPVSTLADDPAYLIYTSGTTGPPKGALHAHRSMLGHLPGFELYYEFFPQEDDLIWTPADWAWIGGLMDVLIPAWYFGKPVLTTEHDFDPGFSVDLMVRHGVTSAFLPPTALKMMRRDRVSSSELSLRGVFSGGEPLGEEMLTWSTEALGARINEGYGQTECNLVIGNCGSTWPVRPGSMGRPVPGHDVAVVDDSGNRIIGQSGEIAVRSPDPVMMLRYWNRPDATQDKYAGDWLLTGDLAVMDEEGYLWFRSRKDDVITSRGYRIGPGEIEESLMSHPAVAMCAVIGVPDDIQGEVPKAFVVLASDAIESDELAAELKQHVRSRLAAHEMPQVVEFIADLPRTTTGKVSRRALREYR